MPPRRHATLFSKNDSGLTLIEAVIAVALFGIIAGSLFALMTSLHGRSIVTRDLTVTTEMMRTQVEQALVLPYDIDTNLSDTVDTRVTPALLTRPGESALSGSIAPSSFTYDYGNETNRRIWTPSFNKYNFSLSATTSFSTVPLYVPADAGRTDSDLSGEKAALKVPMVSGLVKMSTKLRDSSGTSAAASGLVVGGSSAETYTTATNTGLRIFEVWVDPNSRGVAGNGLPEYKMVTFRAPD
jgi:type II secretory pathway pseudopilin PulG